MYIHLFTEQFILYYFGSKGVRCLGVSVDILYQNYITASKSRDKFQVHEHNGDHTKEVTLEFSVFFCSIRGPGNDDKVQKYKEKHSDQKFNT